MNKEQIEQNFGKIVKFFKIPYVGWEMDCYGYICQSKTKKNLVGKPKNILVLTNHNEPYIAKKSELKKLINQMEKYKKEMESASYYL